MDYEYLNRRMTEERQRAADADNEAARDAHLAMAEQFRQQMEVIGSAGGNGLRIVEA